MKTLLLFCLLFCLPAFSANPTFQSFDTNAFIPNASANTIQANTSSSNPNALVKQSQITSGGVSSETVSNIVNANAILQHSGTGTNATLGSTTNIGTLTLLGTGSPTANQPLVKAASGVVAGISGTGIMTNSGSTVGFNKIPIFDGSAITNLNGTQINAATIPLSAINSEFTNVLVFTNGPPVSGQAVVIVGTNVQGGVLMKGTNWPSGGGTSTLLPPNALGVLTNNGSGTTNWSTGITGTWIGIGTLPTTAADTSWMPITNAISGTNQPMTAGQALVVVGTNTYGATLVKGTNWPSGGGSAFPLSADANFNQFSGTNINSLSWRTNDGVNNLVVAAKYDSTTVPASIRLFPQQDLLYVGFNANTLVAQGNGFGGTYEGAVIATNNGVFSYMNSNSITTGTGNFTGGGATGSNIFGGQTVITNITLTTSNAAPGNAVTPVIWLRITNGTSMFLVPGYQ